MWLVPFLCHVVVSNVWCTAKHDLHSSGDATSMCVMLCGVRVVVVCVFVCVCVLRLRGCWCAVGACFECVWCACLCVSKLCVALQRHDESECSHPGLSVARAESALLFSFLSCFCSAVPLLVSSLVGFLISHRTNDTNINMAELGRGLWEHDHGRVRLSFNASCCEDV